MRTTKIVQVEKEITTYKCDLCNFSTTNNSGCCSFQPIMVCNFCKRDACNSKHFHVFYENPGSDYYDLGVCSECYPDAREAWDLADERAGRHDMLRDVAERIFKEIREQRALDRALRASVEIVHPGRIKNDNG